MTSSLHWNIYYGPLLLGLGILVQVFFLLKPRIAFIFPIMGALCISVVCYMDRDIVLFFGQLALLFFLFLLRQK